MELDPTWETAVDKIRNAVEQERLPRNMRDLLEQHLDTDKIQELVDEIRQGAETLHERIQELEQRATDIEEAASAVETFHEAVAAAVDAVDEWENAEDRETKRDARQTLLDALGEIPGAYDGLQSDLTDLEVDDEDDDEPADAGVETVKVLTPDGVAYETKLLINDDAYRVYRGDDPKRASAIGMQLCQALMLPFGDFTKEGNNND